MHTPVDTRDLGLNLINEEIDYALELYPDDAYKKAFTNPHLRQQLINYVMAGIQGTYPFVENQHNLSVKSRIPYRSLELRLRIESYIHWGIVYLLNLNSSSLPFSMFQVEQANYSPYQDINGLIDFHPEIVKIIQ